jgi:hypothetical protein
MLLEGFFLRFCLVFVNVKVNQIDLSMAFTTTFFLFLDSTTVGKVRYIYFYLLCSHELLLLLHFLFVCYFLRVLYLLCSVCQINDCIMWWMA